MSIRKNDNDFIVGTIRNSFGTAEGSLLPPPQKGAFRVPFVTNFKVFKTQVFTGGTQFTLTFNEPTTSLDQIDHYNILVGGLAGAATQYQGPNIANGSPAIVRVTTTSATNVTFKIQTVLKSGLISDLDASPTCTGTTIAATISSSDIPNASLPWNGVTGKIAPNTAGAVAAWDSSGNATVINPVAAGEILSSAGTSNPPVYNTLLSLGIPQIQGTVDLTAQSANIATANLVATTAAQGLFRVSVFEAVTRPATTTSTLPHVVITYTEAESGATITTTIVSDDSRNTTDAVDQASMVLYAQAGTAITYSTTGYASAGGTTMQYCLHLRAEFLG